MCVCVSFSPPTAQRACPMRHTSYFVRLCLRKVILLLAATQTRKCKNTTERKSLLLESRESSLYRQSVLRPLRRVCVCSRRALIAAQQPKGKRETFCSKVMTTTRLNEQNHTAAAGEKTAAAKPLQYYITPQKPLVTQQSGAFWPPSGAVGASGGGASGDADDAAAAQTSHN